MQIKVYRLADNKTAEFAEWDKELLATLEDDDMVSAEEFMPEIMGDPITKTGDIFMLKYGQKSYAIVCYFCAQNNNFRLLW